MKIEFPKKEGRFEEPVFLSEQYGHYNYPTNYYKIKGRKGAFVYGTKVACMRDDDLISISLFKLEPECFKDTDVRKFNYADEEEYLLVFSNVLTFDLE